MNNIGLLKIILTLLALVAIVLWVLVFVWNPNTSQLLNDDNEISQDQVAVDGFGFNNKKVVINESGLEPLEITVEKDNSVLFENNTEVLITLVSEDENLELMAIQPGEEYHTNLLFEAGEYTYFVEELNIEGRITVYE